MKNKLLYSVLLCSIFIFGCSDDFLDKKSLTGLSNDTFWKTQEDAFMGLASCYDGLQNNFLYNGGPWENGFFYMDAMTDNGGHFNWDGWMAGYDITTGIHTPSSLQVAAFWNASYEVVNRCNALISRIGNIDMDANLKATYAAEATVIRALMYMNLTMTYQDVPYVTQERGMDEANMAKTKRAEIVDAIITDLKNAADVLPIRAEMRGRITRGTAWSILGRTALYNEKWDVAADYYQKVMDLGVYGLASDYGTLFTQAGESSNEVVFGVRFEGPSFKEGSSFTAHWNTPMEAINGTLDLAKAYRCTDGLPTSQSPLYQEGVDDLANNRPDALRYNNRDPRLKATLFVPGMKWGNSNAAFYGGAAPSRSTVYVYKYYNPFQSSSDSWDSGQDFYVVRYAEVMLSLAEALVEKGGYDYGKVTKLVNDVRARVGMPSVASVEGTALDREALLEVIKHERRVETAFEGLRLFDLYRWKELEDAVNRIEAERSLFSGIGTYFLYEKRNYRGEKEYVWPIPLSEVDANAKIEQHPLWK